MSAHMRRYTLRIRLPLLIGMLTVICLTAAGAFAQTTPEPEHPVAKTLGQMILGHIDGIFITIGVLSVTGLTLIIQGFMQNRASVMMPEETTNQIREMIAQRKFKELIDFTETDGSFISRALNPALKRAPSFANMKEAMETAIGEQTAEQFRKIEYLNIIGNLGPLLGLLGTVLGMIQAFSEMEAAAGNASPSQLAGGISTALTHTFLGLMLAVPCLAAFGVLRTIVDRLTVRGAMTAEELLLMIKPAESKPAVMGPTGPRVAATPQPTVRKGPLPTPTPPTPMPIATVSPAPTPAPASQP
jgi:biopolymer transport protein ExbB